MKRKFHELNLYSFIFYRHLENNFDLKDSDSGVIFNDSWFWFGIPESILGQMYEILLSCEPLASTSNLAQQEAKLELTISILMTKEVLLVLLLSLTCWSLHFHFRKCWRRLGPKARSSHVLETWYLFFRCLAFVIFKYLLRFVQTKAFLNVKYDVIRFKQRFHILEILVVFHSNRGVRNSKESRTLARESILESQIRIKNHWKWRQNSKMIQESESSKSK